MTRESVERWVGHGVRGASPEAGLADAGMVAAGVGADSAAARLTRRPTIRTRRSVVREHTSRLCREGAWDHWP